MGPLKTLCGLVVAVLVLSGCGGGSGSSSLASVSDSPPSAPASSGSGSSPPTTPPPSSGGSSPPPSGGGSTPPPPPPPPPPDTGSAKLTWTAPTTNSDGSALTGLAGYHIHYGTSAGSLTHTVDIASPATLTYVVANLTAGTWYFAITAYTNAGTESSPSNVGKKTIT